VASELLPAVPVAGEEEQIRLPRTVSLPLVAPLFCCSFGLLRGRRWGVLLAEQVGKFTLEQVEEGGKISFKANGQIDFFGEEALTRVGGAGGPACT
jgi:hypothetical protein